MKSSDKKQFNGLEIKGKKILVLGLARTGVAAARLASSLGADVLVSDIKSHEKLREHIKMLDGLDVKFSLGSHPESLLNGVDLIVVSPGIPGTIPILLKARILGIKIVSEIEFAYNFLKVPVIAITGTNGKTTTTKLVNELLIAAGYRSQALGNIGTPLSGFVLNSQEYDYLVVEVSSFQLEEVVNFKPFISLVLNITPDHMDRYRTIEEYAQAKYRIFERQGEKDFLVLNHDDLALKKLSPETEASVLYFSTRETIKNGCYVKGSEIFFGFEGRIKSVCSLGDIKLEGLHNLENALAAITACSVCRVESGAIKKALNKFKPPPHRIEFVREINGVRFINDSKGTNVGAVVKSLMSYSSPIILIAGGRDKKGDFDVLRDLVRTKVKKLVLIGEAKEKIRKSLNGFTQSIDAVDMNDAVKKSFEAASSGNIVLLSPGCASFDMFSSYEERGVAFRNAVMELK